MEKHGFKGHSPGSGARGLWQQQKGSFRWQSFTKTLTEATGKLGSKFPASPIRNRTQPPR